MSTRIEPQRFKLKCAVHLFLIKDDKILLEKRKNRQWCNNQYDVIAGHIKENKDVISAVIRTAKEEVNIDINKEDIEFIQVMHSNLENEEYIHYFFKSSKWSGDIINNEQELCEKIEWVEFKYPIDNLISYINFAIKNYIENPENKMTLYGWEE